MADTENPVPEDETPTQKQARLRREKRQKKMTEQGEDRLAKIKALNGGVAPPAEVLGGPSVQPGSKQATVNDDPEEVDIDTVSGANTPGGQSARTNAQDNPLASAMLQAQQGQAGPGGEQEEPMLKMMQQISGMMGGGMGQQGGAGGGEGMMGGGGAENEQMMQMLSSLMGGQQQTKQQQGQAPATGSAYLWRIVHALSAMLIGAYTVLGSTFNGSALSRHESATSSESTYGLGPRLFTMFVTAELLLQGSRFYLEKGQLQGSGMIATVANSGLVPEPYAQYIRTAGRWIGIIQSIISDALVIVFVFGALAWWNGANVA
ncbi:hypothetical protein KC354_g8783 [Hortaea werneckii]|uniref:GET complex subunit GET2 n=2 Tax=Hortaea werneckii TaxID=91943 RepID=A0A3M7DL82_HORWE|nr:hypothetical protein KC354_g8783 [Hortaea werneckii]RMY65121.1 hypothetical protein D0863_09335 [Hortaea werneckii]